VRSVELVPETTQATVTKLMRVVSIERKPGQRIANCELKVASGIYRLTIDEATARALAAVFE
jgi:hypothetical protein